ncbi:nitronate monooxygenase [Novosphingobium sp. 1949]|uniref:Propionate 3-nitronate monooxygenase n=1 Tax=Novosphingobium organovorum TaxID=2930092 RepID=A0ABT0BHM2_9SPHN|nr:nitronate monooxygenase [Novosphingobium organovorum]MCJ2184539.1 nitronate monooxygenase [Novosphingobium organovorum]
MFDPLHDLSLALPLIQAPMAGTSTPALAAAVAEAGALGSLAVGHLAPEAAHGAIAELRGRTDRPFNLNLFVHQPPRPDPIGERAWIDALAPQFAAYAGKPPETLETIYTSLLESEAMLGVVETAAPAVVSFHFGLPSPAAVARLKRAGCRLVASVTALEEAQAAQRAGMDALVAQGWEAGGHRGIFDPDDPDAQLSTPALVRTLARWGKLPVIAAGGIMDGADIRTALNHGAVAVQMGTAFLACPETAADAAYRAAMASDAAQRTVMTRLISGRPARCLANRFTALEEVPGLPVVAAYPRAYHAGKALNAAARAQGETGFGAQWAGQGAPRARAMGAADLVRTLAAELAATGWTR